MNIPIPQDIPGLITFWIFLSWIPLLRFMALSVHNKYYEFEAKADKENEDSGFSRETNHIINIVVCIIGLIILWSLLTFALLGFRLLIQMIWC